jgi:hypothetical protein
MTLQNLTEHHYDLLVSVLDHLIDEVGEDEAHPLASLMEVIGVLIENMSTRTFLNLMIFEIYGQHRCCSNNPR